MGKFTTASELDATLLLYYKDGSSTEWQLAATSNSVKFRMPVFAGFAAIQTGTPVLLNDSSLNINADNQVIRFDTIPDGL